MRKNKGQFHANGVDWTGDKSPDCDGVSEDCKASCRNILHEKLQEVETEWKTSVEEGKLFGPISADTRL